MGVSIWDGVNASPKLVKEMEQKEIPTNKSDLLAFAQSFIATINEELQSMTNAGRSVCFPSYNLPEFTVYRREDNSEKAGDVEIMYDSCADTFTAEAMAIAQTELNHRKERHAYLMKIYKEYDENTEKFEGLRSQIESNGGDLEMMRPYVKVDLPADEGSLDIRTYEFPGTAFFYERLRNRLSNMGC